MERNRHTGFTLVELMIALVVAGILMQVVAPGFQKMIKDNHVRSDLFALRAALNTARSEALTRREPVVVCAGDLDGCSAAGANWADGFIAFTDPDNDNDYTVPTTVDEDDLLVVHQSDSPDYINVWLDSGTSFVRFSQQGYTNTTVSFEVCDDRALSDARGIIISAIGHVRAATDTDATADGIANDHAGDNFDCVAPTPPP